MKSVANRDDLILFECGVLVPLATCETLFTVVGEDEAAQARGKAPLSVRELSAKTGIGRKVLPGILDEIRGYNRLMRENRDHTSQDVDLAFRPPAADLYPSQRKANGHLFRPLKGELMDRNAARPGRDTPGDRSALVSKPALSPAA